MSIRILITKLKDDEPTPDDVLGRSATLIVPADPPALVETHRTLLGLADQAPLYIAIMAVAKSLFPIPPSKPNA